MCFGDDTGRNKERQPRMGCRSPCLALVVCLILGPVPSWLCLQCDPNFALHFASYAPFLSRKSWGLGDVPAAGRMLRGWAQNTLEDLHLGVPPEITMVKLELIASTVYGKLDTLFKGNTYKPGVLPEIMRSIYKEQIKMLRNAIIERINHYDAISCVTCLQTKPTCFGYNCESSEHWEEALKRLYEHINSLSSDPNEWMVALRQLPGFSHCTSTSPESLNFTSIKHTLSKNWLNVMALKELQEDIPIIQLLAPIC